MLKHGMDWSNLAEGGRPRKTAKYLSSRCFVLLLCAAAPAIGCEWKVSQRTQTGDSMK